MSHGLSEMTSAVVYVCLSLVKPEIFKSSERLKCHHMTEFLFKLKRRKVFKINRSHDKGRSFKA